MRLCGWKTRDMFDRYNIIDASDLSSRSRTAVQRQGTANKPAEVQQVN